MTLRKRMSFSLRSRVLICRDSQGYRRLCGCRMCRLSMIGLARWRSGLIGAPWDGGTTNRAGPRHGPRQLRDLSTMIRAMNGVTWVAPFELAQLRRSGRCGAEPGGSDG